MAFWASVDTLLAHIWLKSTKHRIQLIHTFRGACRWLTHLIRFCVLCLRSLRRLGMLQKSTQFLRRNFSKKKLFTPKTIQDIAKTFNWSGCYSSSSMRKKCIEGRRENARTCPRIVGKLLIFFSLSPSHQHPVWELWFGKFSYRLTEKGRIGREHTEPKLREVPYITPQSMMRAILRTQSGWLDREHFLSHMLVSYF